MQTNSEESEVRSTTIGPKTEAEMREFFEREVQKFLVGLFMALLAVGISSVFMLRDENRFHRENMANLKNIIRALQE